MARIPEASNIPQLSPGQSQPFARAARSVRPSPIGRAVAGVGEDVQQLGEAFAVAEQRLNRRRDAVGRARAVSAYTEQATTELRRLQTEEDLSAPQTLDRFGAFLSEQETSVIDSHEGSEESQARLAERLVGLRAIFANQGAALAVQAQRALITDTFGQRLSALTARAAEQPGQLENLFQQLEVEIDDMAPALSPDEERDLREGGRAQIVLSAVESVLDRGGIAEAEQLLKTPGFETSLGVDQARRIRSRITIAKAADEKARTAGLREVQKTEQILGRKMTPDERVRLAGVQPSAGRKTLSSQVVEFEQVMGRPATQEEISKMAGALTEEDRPFGTSLTGRALDIVTEGAPAFGAGLLTDDEERRFMSAVTQLTQPITVQNPDTGLLETRRPELPPFVTDALARRGIVLGEMATAQATAPTTSAPTATQPAGPGAAMAAEPAPAAAIPQGQTIFDLAGLATGPIPTAAEALGRTPLVGQFVRTPQINQARTFIPLVQRELIRVLQNNPRFAEGERQAIEDEIDIRPQFFDDPNAFRDRLIAIDDALQVRLRNALSTAQSPRVGREERIQAMNVANGIVKFRESLGVPPRVQTPDEARKLGPGALFIDPEGVVRRVPSEATAETQ